MRFGRKTLEEIKEEDEIIRASDLDLKLKTPQFWKRDDMGEI